MCEKRRVRAGEQVCNKMQASQEHIPLEEGWNKMEGGFSKFIDIMEGGFREPFALALHSELYT